jgi:arabinan endo-1,5-alpha-L-arabinosidase
MLCRGGSDIDLQPFRDPHSGRWYGYWGANGNIAVQELAGDLTAFAPGSGERVVLLGFASRTARPYERGIEGPFVVEREGWYYLWYSGDNCCELPPHYAALVARARSPVGPFRRLGRALGRPSSAVLEGGARFDGPGHGAIVRDARGADWFVYHAVDLREPVLGDGGIRRVLMLDRVRYRDGWPVVAGGEPSTSRRPGPATRRPAAAP